MRTGALVLGIIAGLAGLVSAVFALFVGGLGGAFDAEGAGTVFHNREDRERYMDGLEWQMELQREQIDRTLEQTSEDSDRRRKALEKLRSSLTSFPGRTPVRGAAEGEMQ